MLLIVLHNVEDRGSRIQAGLASSNQWLHQRCKMEYDRTDNIRKEAALSETSNNFLEIALLPHHLRSLSIVV